MKATFHRSRHRAWIALVLAVPTLLLGVDRAVTDGDITEAVVDAIRAPSELEDLSRTQETREGGGLSNQGRSERRADFLWGWILLGGGGALAFWAVTELASSRRALAADDAGLYLPVASSANDVFVPWDRVQSVRSTVVDDDSGPTRTIEITLSGNTWIPSNPRGAVWDGDRLLVDADDWRMPAREAAGLLEVMLERSRHVRPDPTSGQADGP